MSAKKNDSKPISSEATNFLNLFRQNKVIQHPKPQSSPSPIEIENQPAKHSQ
jgi:hypothetical protein